MEMLEFVVLRLSASFPINALTIKWYSMPENLSLGFANKDADQSAYLRNLISACIVH